MNVYVTIAEVRHEDVRSYGTHPGDAIREEINHTSGKIEVDSFGLALGRFSRLHLDALLQRPDAIIRLLVQDPRTQMFEQVVRQEQQARVRCIRDIVLLTEKIFEYYHGASAVSSDQEIPSTVELRWYADYPTVTGVRIDGTFLVRPRSPREVLQTNTFFERYTMEQGRPYVAYMDLFRTVWEDSFTPSEADLEEARRLIQMPSDPTPT